MPTTITAIAAWAAAQAPGGADLCTALSVKDAIQTCANREQYLYELAPSLFAVSFLADTIGWVAPAGVQWALAFGCGGGGGGGGGHSGPTVDSVYACGGGGGGAARMSCVPVPLVPGDAYDILIGSGGAGGAASSEGAPGNATQIMRIATTYAWFLGGGGGGGNANSAGATGELFLRGGLPYSDSVSEWLGWGTYNKSIIFDPASAPFNASTFFTPCVEGEGGASKARSAGRNGMRMVTAAGQFIGGFGGSIGAHILGRKGGGGGGGGGGGPWGGGGAGGNGGGSGGGASPGSAGAAGTAAGANSGGGGGAGGGGGGGSSGGAGGAGAAGGSGRLVLLYGIKG